MNQPEKFNVGHMIRTLLVTSNGSAKIEPFANKNTTSQIKLNLK